MIYKNLFKCVFIAQTLFLSTAFAFGVQLFSPGFPINIGGSNSVVFTGDYPARVTFKIAVQNKDNTLSAIESFSAPNTMTGDFIRIYIPSDVEAGINYWFVAVDSANELNYATLGPLVIREMFGSGNPTASITAGSSSTSYQTGGSNNAVASATNSLTNIKPSGSFSIPTGLLPTSVYTPKSTPDNTNHNDDHNSGPSVGVIAGIAVGGFVLVTIIGCVLYCCCIKKAVKTFAPIVNNLSRPNDVNNESSIPITSKPFTAVNTSDVHKTPVSPSVTLAKPQNQQMTAAPANPQMMPSSPVSAQNTTDYSINASNEIVYNHQYPSTTHQQQSYPFYPYPYNSQQGLPYPPQDFMPIPEHFNSGGLPYPPLSPTAQHNNTYSFQQQNYTPYGNQQNWESQHTESTLVGENTNPYMYPPVINAVTDSQTNKTEYVQALVSNSVYTQKVEYNGVQSDKAEYIQKPDDYTVHNKPDSPTVQKYNKPHEREV